MSGSPLEPSGLPPPPCPNRTWASSSRGSVTSVAPSLLWEGTFSAERRPQLGSSSICIWIACLPPPPPTGPVAALREQTGIIQTSKFGGGGVVGAGSF